MIHILLQELKKILIKRRVICVFAFVLLASGIYNFFREPARNVDRSIEDNKDCYIKIMNKIEGKSNLKNRKYIDELKNEIDDAEFKMLKMADEYESGIISQAEYVNNVIKLSNILTNKNVVDLIGSHQEYVIQDEKQRYYLYQNGWIDLFQSTGIDIALFVLVLLAITPVFCKEYETDMYIINRISSGGNKYMYRTKIIASMVVTTTMSIILCIENILVEYFRFGLKGISYPIQSIHIWGNYPWKLNIGQMLIIYILLSILAAIYLSSIIIFFSVITKKVLNTILITLSVVFIPMFILEEKMIYKLPMPINLLKKQGYLIGIYNIDIGKTDFFSRKQLLITFIIVIVLCAVLVTLGDCVYHYVGKAKGLSIKKITTWLLVIIIFFSGCGKKQNEKEEIFNNIGWGKVFVNGKKIINATGDNIVIKSDSEEEKIIRDPFLIEQQKNMTVNGICGNTAYITRTYAAGDYDIMSIDLNNYECKTVYEHHVNVSDGYNYLGMQREDLSSYGIQKQENISACFATVNKLYVLIDECIYGIDINTKKRSLIADDVNSNVVSYREGKIYYINKGFNLACYTISKKKLETINNGLVSCVYALNDFLLIQYTSADIYSMDYETGQISKICDSIGDIMNANNNYIFCYNTPRELCMLDIETGKIVDKIKTKRDICEVKSTNDGSNIYIVTVKENQFFLEKY